MYICQFHIDITNTLPTTTILNWNAENESRSFEIPPQESKFIIVIVPVSPSQRRVVFSALSVDSGETVHINGKEEVVTNPLQHIQYLTFILGPQG